MSRVPGRRASDVSASDLHVALGRLTVDALRPGAAACTLLYAFYTVAYALQLTTKGAPVGLVMSALTSVFFLAVRVGLHGRSLPQRFVNPLGASYGVAVGLNCLVSQAATGNAELSPNLMLCIVTMPLFLLDARWLVIVIAPLVGGWFVVQNTTRVGTTWHMQTYPLIASVVVAALVYSVRRQTHWRLEETRLELRRAAERDSLTGLFNRRGFLAAGEELLARPRESAAAVLLFVDFDGLKQVNDSDGHAAGDALLRAAAAALDGAFSAQDVVGRLGGDEFAVLVVDGTSPEAAAQRVHERVALAARTASGRPLSLSIGAAVTRAGAAEPLEHLLNRADRAMYEGRSRRLAG